MEILQLRRKTNKNKLSIYENLPVIRVSNIASSRFVVSKLIVEKLNINPEIQGLMFTLKEDKLYASKETIAEDNYILGKYDAHNYRFSSKELQQKFTSIFNKTPYEDFFVELQPDHSLKLITL